MIGPFFNDDFGDVFGSIVALTADGFSEEETREFAEKIRSQLLRVPDVAKVDLFGVQPEKVFIEISQKRLAQLGLDMSQVLGQLAAQNAVEGAGVAGDAGAWRRMRASSACTRPASRAACSQSDWVVLMATGRKPCWRSKSVSAEKSMVPDSGGNVSRSIRTGS